MIEKAHSSLSNLAQPWMLNIDLSSKGGMAEAEYHVLITPKPLKIKDSPINASSHGLSTNLFLILVLAEGGT